MRQIVFILSVIFFAGLKVNAQSADQVVGYWLTEKKTSQVEIYKTPSGKYEGKLVWLKDPLDENGRPKTDKDNPTASMRNRPLKGVLLLKDFTYNASSKEWTGGTIYDPENGKTYDAFMWFDKNGVLNIKGFVMGMRWMGRSTTWVQETALRN
jgi:uncharacterized protein (DUF2147 family)